MLAAGEASGDLHGAAVCRGLKGLAPACRLVGMGGARMAAAGMELLVDVTASAVVGGSEALSRLPVLYRALHRLRAALEEAPRPAALVLIDFPEFNLRLARAARRVGVPVVYFIPPQVWAWRRGRVRTIRRLVSLVLAVFPFEPPFYRLAGVPVAFVGHPLLDALADAPDRAAARRELGLAAGARVVGLLPGSRREEVARMLPVMGAAAARIRAATPEVQFVLARAPTVEAEAIARHVGGMTELTMVAGRAHAVLRAADLALVTSGTATLEAALLGTPMVVCYRLSRLSGLAARLLIRVPWISLANLTLGRAVVPELYQASATGERLAEEALRLFQSPGALGAQREAFRELAGRLGEPGVGVRAARLVLAEAGAVP
ncbi:MAG: lipid-A-disaccharide synthase [Candidatus Rokubacteria bacterium RIFCSPLOWO2_12_FULL_71_22]|nr:MAG: lipid-A-disaccharide synthase [Candidatus Rokubacteria bacterium RIFCSPLOWO2_12_FULL_71_22]